jgi:hypothetical protein
MSALLRDPNASFGFHESQGNRAFQQDKGLNEQAGMQGQ